MAHKFPSISITVEGDTINTPSEVCVRVDTGDLTVFEFADWCQQMGWLFKRRDRARDFMVIGDLPLAPPMSIVFNQDRLIDTPREIGT